MTKNHQPLDPTKFSKLRPPKSPLTDEITRKMSQLQNFGRDISAFINGFQLNVDRNNGAVQINLRKKTRPLVELIPLLKYCEEVNPLEAIIGWNKTQQPMLWSATPDAKNHLLISGAPQAGKTGLLRSLILTLVLATRPSQLQLAIIDGSCRGGNHYDHSGLKKFSLLPHLLNRPPANPEEVCEIVSFLAKEADHRLTHHIQTPQILLVIDNLQDILPVAGPEFHQQLERILDIGSQTGIRVILATNRPEDGRLQDLLAGIEIDRMTGKVQSAGQAAFASGRDDSDAECLEGNGEFLAALSAENFHFQAAWVSEKHLNRYLKYINDAKQPALVAWSIPADEFPYDGLGETSEDNIVETYHYGFLEPDANIEQETIIDEDDETDFDLGTEKIIEEIAEDVTEEVVEQDEPLFDERIEARDAAHLVQAKDDFGDEPVQDIPIEYVADNRLAHDQYEELDFEEDSFENDIDHLDEKDESLEPNEDRLTQLANIYTKLTGFWTEEPEEKKEVERNRGRDQLFPTHEYLEDDFEDDEWDEEDEFDATNELVSYEKIATPETKQPRLVFHEPEPEYKPKSNGWLDFAADSSASSEESSGVEEALADDLIDETTDDKPFSFSAENIAKPGRRSRLSHAGNKFKESEENSNSTDQPHNPGEPQIDPFDPWQNGLDDDPDHEKTKPTAIVRPPRLVAKKPPIIRKRVSHASNHFKPKPKPTPTPEPNKTTEENIDGEIE